MGKRIYLNPAFLILAALIIASFITMPPSFAGDHVEILATESGDIVTQQKAITSLKAIQISDGQTVTKTILNLASQNYTADVYSGDSPDVAQKKAIDYLYKAGVGQEEALLLAKQVQTGQLAVDRSVLKLLEVMKYTIVHEHPKSLVQNESVLTR